MSTLIICLMIAVIMPYLAKLPLAMEMNKVGGYDNHHPREQQKKLLGYGARASAAHQNSFEALAIFSTAAITALATNHTSDTIQYLAISFIVFRVLYHIFYLCDLATLRSSIWFLSLLSCLSILWLCL